MIIKPNAILMVQVEDEEKGVGFIKIPIDLSKPMHRNFKKEIRQRILAKKINEPQG